MSYFDYRASQQLMRDDPPFYALIMAAMRKADTRNLDILIRAWPLVHEELVFRYNAPCGVYPSEISLCVKCNGRILPPEDLVWFDSKPYHSACAPGAESTAVDSSIKEEEDNGDNLPF